MGRNQLLGARGEELVASHLEANGYRILDRNWRIKSGEVDLIALSASDLVIFVEVKTRSSTAFGHPLEAITGAKGLRLQKLALAWLVMHQRWGDEYRIDCAAVVISGDSKFEIDYREAVL